MEALLQKLSLPPEIDAYTATAVAEQFCIAYLGTKDW